MSEPLYVEICGRCRGSGIEGASPFEMKYPPKVDRPLRKCLCCKGTGEPPGYQRPPRQVFLDYAFPGTVAQV